MMMLCPVSLGGCVAFWESGPLTVKPLKNCTRLFFRINYLELVWDGFSSSESGSNRLALMAGGLVIRLSLVCPSVCERVRCLASLYAWFRCYPRRRVVI